MISKRFWSFENHRTLIQGTLHRLVNRKCLLASIVFPVHRPFFSLLLHAHSPSHARLHTHTRMPGTPLQLCLHIQHAVMEQLFLMRTCSADGPSPGHLKETAPVAGEGRGKGYWGRDKATDTCLFICFFQNVLPLDDGYSFSSSRPCPITPCMLELTRLRNF